jgi:hypothetical protein
MHDPAARINPDHQVGAEKILTGKFDAARLKG